MYGIVFSGISGKRNLHLRKVCVFLALIILLQGLACCRTERAVNLNAIRAKEKVHTEPMGCARMFRNIERVFNYPLNVEFTGQACDADISFGIRRRETLRSVLDRVSELTGMSYVVEHGQLCILPDGEKSNLDRYVSVKYDETSVWNAIKDIVMNLNVGNEQSHPLSAQPADWIRSVDPVVTEYRPLNVHLEHVTAREAILAVFKASELDINYAYYGGLSHDILSIEIGKDRRIISRKGQPRGSDEDYEWWKKEIAEIKATFPTAQ